MDPEAVRAAVTVTEVTHDIRVTVIPEYLEEHSEPARNTYAFSYTITIENLGRENVQLVRRHWVVNSGGAEYMQVKGDGVVGEQPVLEGNSGFRYSSGTVIKDPVGSMHGWYTFQRDSGREFDVTIPRFDLIYPHLLH
jgi:ApaG protein